MITDTSVFLQTSVSTNPKLLLVTLIVPFPSIMGQNDFILKSASVQIKNTNYFINFRTLRMLFLGSSGAVLSINGKNINNNTEKRNQKIITFKLWPEIRGF